MLSGSVLKGYFRDNQSDDYGLRAKLVADVFDVSVQTVVLKCRRSDHFRSLDYGKGRFKLVR